jgi:hypothetical protein
MQANARMPKARLNFNFEGVKPSFIAVNKRNGEYFEGAHRVLIGTFIIQLTAHL